MARAGPHQAIFERARAAEWYFAWARNCVHLEGWKDIVASHTARRPSLPERAKVAAELRLGEVGAGRPPNAATVQRGGTRGAVLWLGGCTVIVKPGGSLLTVQLCRARALPARAKQSPSACAPPRPPARARPSARCPPAPARNPCARAARPPAPRAMCFFWGAMDHTPEISLQFLHARCCND